jgi:hypothetical protein
VNWIWRLLLLLAICPGSLAAADFKIAEVKTYLEEGVYLLDAEIEYRFNDTVLEALNHGVPLTLEVHLQVRRDGAWVWEQDTAELRLRYLISYRAITSLYEVSDLNQETSRSFVTREAALGFLGEINRLPIVDAQQLESGSAYWLEMKTQLDIEALPLPLRPLAYLTPDWNLSSGWSSWPLQP